ncbi:MAG: hypothetical protein WDN30_14115 [Pararobbsia sp.]
MITFAVEPWSKVWPEMPALWEEHWREVALNHDVIKLEPDIVAYNALERAGLLHVLVARAAGDIIGYYIAIVQPHLHYRSSLSAMTDVYFIRAKYRRPRTALNFFRQVEASLVARGVQKIFTATKLHTSPDGRVLDHGRLFRFLGYTESERVFTKIIGKPR